MADPNVHDKRPYRLPGWASLTIFSIVVLAAMNSRGYSTGAEKWVIALSSISLTFSFLATAAYLIPDARHMFIGEKPEGGLALFILVLWCVGLPIIMDPSRSIAVSPSPQSGLSYVWNANLYFFSWASFICIAFICGSLAKENVVGADEALSSITPKLGKWYMLVIASVIVLASASQFQKSQCGSVDSQTCTSNKYAISLGAVAMVFTLAISVLAYLQSLSIYIETVTAFLLFIMYTAGVGVITFDFGSGVTIGNLVSLLCHVIDLAR